MGVVVRRIIFREFQNVQVYCQVHCGQPNE
jgi:hypothetical protein